MNGRSGNQTCGQSGVNQRGESMDDAYKPQGDSGQNRCACCNCNPNHECSSPYSGEVSGFRKLLKDMGIGGFSLGFCRKTPVCTNSGRGTQGKAERCDCVRHIEQLLTQIEVCRPSPGPGAAAGAKPAGVLEGEGTCKRKPVSSDLPGPDANTTENMNSQQQGPNDLPVSANAQTSSTAQKGTVNDRGTEGSQKPEPDSPDEKSGVPPSESCALPPRIEIWREREICTCDKCRNIHYMEKHYLPTASLKKCLQRIREGKEAPSTGGSPGSVKKCDSRTESRSQDNDQSVSGRRTSGSSTATTSSSTRWKNSENAEGSKSVLENERFIKESNLDFSSVGCEYDGGKGSTGEDQTRRKKSCDCSVKLKTIEDRLRALEGRKKLDSSLSSQSDVKRRDSSQSSESRRKHKGTGTAESSSLENIESETDNEVKTRVITCGNLNFFTGGDHTTKCKCTEDTFCSFKHTDFITDVSQAKKIFFLTNIELLREWSGMYGCAEYTYRKSFWDVDESAVKPVKIQRDWRQVKTAFTSFFRKRRKNLFKRRKKDSGWEVSSVGSFTSRSGASSLSNHSLLNACSPSRVPFSKESFHILTEGPQLARTAGTRKKRTSNKNLGRMRRKSRRRQVQ